MTEYDEGEVLAFAFDLADAYESYGIPYPTSGITIWIARMQFDAIPEGYAAARAKHLGAARAELAARALAEERDPP